MMGSRIKCCRCLALAMIGILPAFVLSAATAAEDGLVAHWTFDEGRGSVLTDVSGNGNHGRIHGATFVQSRNGYALQFDGVNDYVDCGQNPILNLEGNMTIEAWVKPYSFPRRDQIIIGDTAAEPEKRNFNFYVYANMLRFQHGDGEEPATYRTIPEEVFREGTWRHVAFVGEYPKYFFYIDGKQPEVEKGYRRNLRVPILRTRGGRKCIGVGFKGEIDEIRVYNRAIPEVAMLRKFGREVVCPGVEMELRPHFIYSKGSFDPGLTLFCSEVLVSHKDVFTAELAVSRIGESGPAKLEARRLEAIAPGSEAWKPKPEVRFRVKDLVPGQYSLKSLIRKNGSVISDKTVAFTCPQQPAWFGSKAGMSDKVLPPYTAVRISKRQEGVSVHIWGRRYDFGLTPFMRQIVSKGDRLNSNPIQLTAMGSRAPMVWSPKPPRVIAASAARALLLQEFSGRESDLLIKTEVEYDGFARVDWSLKAKRAMSLDKLILEIPMVEKHAKYLYCGNRPVVHSGLLREDFCSGFKPLLWIGDDERGLSWLCESDQNWYSRHPEKAIQVLKRGQEVILRLALVDTRTELRPGVDLSYTFALQATPIKPIETDCWDYGIGRDPWYGEDYAITANQIEGKPALQYMAERGLRALIINNWTGPLAYPLPLGHEQDLKDLTKAAGRYGIKVLPYLGFQISQQAPEYSVFGEEVVVNPPGWAPDRYLKGPDQMMGFVCLRSIWQDALVDGVARLMNEYGAGGVYLDTTISPFACTNELHGCGYRKADGTLTPTYPIFAVRNTLKRFYTVVKEKSPEGLVDAHVYDCMNSSALAFVTSYWSGEQLRPKAADLFAELPLDRFRAEMIGRNWGVPAEFLHYTTGCEYSRSFSIALLHDVPVRSHPPKEMVVLSSIRDLLELFGRRESEWLPYWKNADYVRVSPDRCYVSLYRHPRNGVLAIVSNLSNEIASIELRLNLQRLGLSGSPVAKDGLTQETVSVEGNKLSLAMDPLQWKPIWIR